MEKERLQKIADWAHMDLVGTMLPWWCSEYIMDYSNGGYYGVVTLDMQRNYDEPRGLTLLGRMLYVFSASYRTFKGQLYLDRANYVYRDLMNHFYDSEFGGAITSVDENNMVVNDIKPNYCQAFFIMGLAEYYRATGCEEALKVCMETVELMETKCKFAPGMYHATMNRDWTVCPGFDNGRKNGRMMIQDDAVMFTHHLLQAYFRLYEATGDEKVAGYIKDMMNFLLDKLYDKENHNFMTLVAMNSDFARIGTSQSYGHDAELSYLVINVADALGDEALKEKAYRIVKEVLEVLVDKAFDMNGCMYNGADLVTGKSSPVHVWWAMSEAVSAMLCGYDLTGEEKYLKACEGQINFIEKYFVNRETGDWYNNILSDETGGHVSDGQHGFDKLNAGKCPFHNGQMCLETMKRVAKMLDR